MALLSLTPDVLSSVLALLSTQDALALACVSRAAHALALPRIHAHLSLGGAFHRPAHRPSPNAQLRAFCAALRAHPERAILVRELELRRDAVRKDRGYAIDADAVRLLADLIARARALQCVTLWGLAQLVDACPQIVDALACCDRLQTVVLGGGVPALDVLQRAFPYVRSLEFVEGGGACFAPVRSSSLPPATNAWSNLDCFSSGRAPALSHATQTLHTRRLILMDPVPNDDAVIEHTLAFIKHARPYVLSLNVDADVPDAAFVERLRDVCFRVRFLELALSGCRSLASVENWMTRITPTLATLPLAGLALRSAGPAAFPTPRPTPAASPLSSPRLASAALTIDADALALGPSRVQAETVYGAPRPAPPERAALAKTLGAAAPGLRWVALAPAGAAETEWFEVGGARAGTARCLGEAEAASVRRTLECFGRWD
ncbi:hypothetical protein C8Q72DRAFT_888343 [Fomitopsis betulina]|nr:hypothetical protein C8Q72DRAFT_888343 [Fomitopsis betulina]